MLTADSKDDAAFIGALRDHSQIDIFRASAAVLSEVIPGRSRIPSPTRATTERPCSMDN